MMAQFVDQIRGTNITRQMFAPSKNISDPFQWYKNARGIIPQLPFVCTGACKNFVSVCAPELQATHGNKDHWHFEWEHIWEVTPNYIKFQMQNGIGERCHLVIDRKQSGLA